MEYYGLFRLFLMLKLEFKEEEENQNDNTERVHTPSFSQSTS